MPAINIARTDTLEMQRVKVNDIASQLFNVTSGGSDLQAGNIKLGDGTVSSPSLAFTNDPDLGIYKQSNGVFGFVSNSKKLSDLSEGATKYYRDFVVEKNSLDSLLVAIQTPGTNYDSGSYPDVPTLGGTGDGGALAVTVAGFVGTITQGGTGYTPGTYQGVSVGTSGSGTGATIDFTIDEIGGVLTAGGSNYQAGSYSGVALTGGTGTGLAADFTVDSWTTNTTGGTGYPDGIFKSIPLTGGNGANFLANISVSGGSVQEFGAAGGSEVISADAGYAISDQLTGTLPLAGTQTFVVKAASGRYYFDGKQAGNFSLFKGKTYVFNLTDPSNDSHPAFFCTTVDDTATIIGTGDGVTYTLDGTDVSEADWLANFTGSTTKQITFVVPAAPNTPNLFFSCGQHAAMGGDVTLTDHATGNGLIVELTGIGGLVSAISVTSSGDGQYTSGDVVSVAGTDLMSAGDVGAGVVGSGFQYTLGANFGSILAIDDYSAYGTGYAINDTLNLPAGTTNVSTFARGEIDITGPGTTFVSTGAVNTYNLTGIAAGSANATFSNITPSGGSGAGFNIDVNVIYAGGNASYDSITINNAGTGYLPSEQLLITGDLLGGATPNNDLTIAIQTVAPSNPQITVASTTGIQVGDTVDIIANINNDGQVAAGTVVQSVDNATQITLSISPPTPGDADIRITNANSDYLTVPDSSLIGVGMNVTKVSGTGDVNAGTTVLAIVDATTVQINAAPSTVGSVVLSFIPEYGNGSGFEFTINQLGVVTEVSVANGGNGYTKNDILTVNSSDLVQPDIYTVTNTQVDQVVPSSTIAAAAIQVGDSIRDPGGAIQAATITASTTVASANDQNYTGVASTASGSGVNAKFDVFRDNVGAVLSATITTGDEGIFYALNEVVTIAGNLIGGASPADDVTLSVSSVGSAGSAQIVRKVKTSGGNISYFIIDRFGFNAGGYFVNENAPTTAYGITSAETNYSFWIDPGTGTALYRPALTFYAGNSYEFNLNSATLGGHIFALSSFPDGRWDRVDSINATLVATATTITVGSTTGLKAGMIVEKVLGDQGAGAFAAETKIVSVTNSTSFVIDKQPSIGGAIEFDAYGAEYTDGVTRVTTAGAESLTIKVTETTPTLYYYCDTNDTQHTNEGGEDGEESELTIDLNNPKTFGSGFQLLVSDIVIEEVVKGEVLTGAFTVKDIISTDGTINNGIIANLDTSVAKVAVSLETPLLTAPLTVGAVPGTNLSIKTDTNKDIEVITQNFKYGAEVAGTFTPKLTIAAATGNLEVATGGYIKSDEFKAGDNLKITGPDATISSLGSNDLVLNPAIGRIVDVTASSGLAVPAGDTASRPGPAITKDGVIRFNTTSNQYEGYHSSTTSWSSLGGVRDLDGNTYMLAEKTVGANDNTIWFYNDDENTLKVTPTFLEFFKMKKIRSVNVLAPDYTEWNANAPVTTGTYLKWLNNLYEVTTAGTTATTGNEPVHTSGALANGTAVLTWWGLGVAPLEFDDIEELRIGPNNTVPVVISGDLRLFGNEISTDINDINIRPNSGKKVKIDGATSLVVPSGNTAQRGVAERGSIRYNSSTLQYEGFDGLNWGSLGGVKDVDQDTYIVPELTAGGDEDTLYFYNAGNNSLRLTQSAFEFYSVDTIVSSTSDEFEITASLFTFDNAATTLDNTNTTKTFLHSSKQYFDIGVSSGVYTDPILRLDDQGDVYLNTGYGTGNYNGVKVFDSDLKEFELADLRILTDVVTLVKGSSNTGNSIIYPTATEKGAKVTVCAENTSNGAREMYEFGVVDDTTNVVYNEYGNLRTGAQLIVPTFEMTTNNEVRLNISLGANVLATHTVKVTVVSNITKK